MLKEQIPKYVREIERLEAKIDKLNMSKSEQYKAARDEELDVAALRRVIAHRRKRGRKNGDKADESLANFNEYLAIADAAPSCAHEGSDDDEPDLPAHLDRRNEQPPEDSAASEAASNKAHSRKELGRAKAA